MVGHLGTEQLGGLAVASTLLLTGYFLFVFLAYGTTASVARLVGGGDLRGAAHEGVQGMWLALGIGVVLTAVGLAFAPWGVSAMGAEGDVHRYALLYLRISMLGVPALLLALAGTGYLRGLQDTRTPLVVTAASVVANLVIELVLIYGFGYGIGASAVATVVAQTGGAVAYVLLVARDVRARDVAVAPDPPAIRRLAVVGRDLFVRTAALRLALLVATAVAARIGTVSLGAHQIAFELWSFLALVLDSVAIAAQAMIGRLLGAGRPDEARAAARRMLQWGVATGFVLGLAVVALRGPLPDLFTDDGRVAGRASEVLWFVAALQPLNAVVFVLDGVLIGAGDLRYLAWAMVGAASTFVPAAGIVLPLDLGLSALWWAIVLLMAVRAAALVWRFEGPRWQVAGAQRS